MAEDMPKDMKPLSSIVSITKKNFNDILCLKSSYHNRCIAKKADNSRAAPNVVTQDELRKLRGDVQKGSKAEHAMIMTKDELARIKASTKIETNEDKAATKRIMD